MTGDAALVKTTSQTLDRGLQVLEAVARSPSSITISEIATVLGVHRTIAHRLVGTLAARGYLRREPAGGYRLGSTCLALASAVSDLRTIARPVLDDLARTTDETASIVVLSGPDVVYLDSIESSKALRVAGRAGRRLPAYTTSVGKALLATLPPERVRELYPNPQLPKVTDRTITDRDQLERELAAIRRRGYGTNAGESETGVGSIGMVVYDGSGEPCAAISLAVPLSRMTARVKREFIEALTATVATIGERLS